MFEFSTYLLTTPEKALDRARVLFAFGRVEVTGAGHNELSLTGPRPTYQETNTLMLIKTGHLTIGGGRVAIKAELRTPFPKLLFFMGPIIMAIAPIVFLTGITQDFARDLLPPLIIGLLFTVAMPFAASWIKKKLEAEIRRAITSIAME
ncbi:hypothetical protein LLG95_04840 [bacterium]|nr:hypothetical protein [bacterium]